MSTITPTEPMTMPAGPAPSSAFVIVQGGDQRTVFPGVDWHTYQQLSEATGESPPFRLIYDGKDLEIMVIGNIHELYKELLGKIVNAVAMGLDLDSVGCGQTTWKTEIRGLEADLSYYFDPEKIRVAREALARRSMNAADYPRPDLAIEIDMCPPQVDRPAIYKDLGVTEVWRLVKGQELDHRAAPGGRNLHPDRGKPVPAHPRRGCSPVAERGGHGAPSRLEPSPESMGDGIGTPGRVPGRLPGTPYLTPKIQAWCPRN